MNNTTLQEEEICFKVDIFPLFAFGFVVNVFALIAVLKAKPRESTRNGAKQIHILICCLAGSDTTSLGLQCLMPLASFLNCGWWGGKVTCSLFGFVNAILILWSAWIVALLSFQRFLVTVFPFQHQSAFTTKKIKSALIYLFFIVCLFVSPPFFGVGEFVYYETGQFCSLSLTPTGIPDTIFLGILVTQGLTCVVLVLVFNIHVIASLKSRRSTFHRQTVRAMDDSSSTFVSLTKKVALVFCVCNTPLLIRMAVDLGKQTTLEELGLEHTITMALMFANTLANPFIYVACRKRYRYSLQKLLCFHRCNGSGVVPSNSVFIEVAELKAVHRLKISTGETVL